MRLHYYIRPVNQQRPPPLLLSQAFSGSCYSRVELGSIKFLLRDANFNARGELYPNARELITMRYENGPRASRFQIFNRLLGGLNSFSEKPFVLSSHAFYRMIKCLNRL